MLRRDFITRLGAAAAALPLAARAQETRKLYRVGFLGDSPAVFADAIEAFRRELVDLGWSEGPNIAIEYRWAEGRLERMHELAEELVRLKVDIIVVPSSIYTEVAKRATSTIPIIFMSHAGPIESGHVDSLSRPGGNITGLSVMLPETSVKTMELLKEAVPALSLVAVIWDPATPSHGPGLKAVKAAGPALGLRIQSVPVHSATEYDSGFTSIVGEHADAVLMLGTPLYFAGAARLAELAIKHKLPLLGAREFAKAGGLLSFGANRVDLFRHGAIYVDKILKGANPAELPVEQPTKFELLINLKTAKLLGLILPPQLLARADEVIE